MDVATIYFNAEGFAIFYKNKAISRRQIKGLQDENETLFELCWRNLGLALLDAISENIGFIHVVSDTAVIDILNGSKADIHTPLSLKMYHEIRDKGMDKFFHVQKTKANTQEVQQAFIRADEELGRHKEGNNEDQIILGS